MNVKIFIFENDIHVLQEIVIHLQDLGYQSISTAISFEKALKQIDKSYPDIALLDIREPEDSKAGIKIANELNRIKRIPVIYMTAFPEDISFAYETRPNAFIEKPNYVDVYHAIDLAIRSFYDLKEEATSVSIFNKKTILILKKGVYYKIKKKDILYAVADSGCITIHCHDNSFVLSSTLKFFVEQIKDSCFLIVHRSNCINVRHLKSFNKKSLTINGTLLKISSRGYDLLMSSFEKLKSK